MKIGRKRMGLLINFKGVCRTAPATPGLLKRRSRGGMRRKRRGGTKKKMERKFKELGKEEGQGTKGGCCGKTWSKFWLDQIQVIRW